MHVRIAAERPYGPWHEISRWHALWLDKNPTPATKHLQNQSVRGNTAANKARQAAGPRTHGKQVCLNGRDIISAKRRSKRPKHTFGWAVGARIDFFPIGAFWSPSHVVAPLWVGTLQRLGYFHAASTFAYPHSFSSVSYCATTLVASACPWCLIIANVLTGISVREL